MTRPATVIDGDGHICEPELVWTEYTASKYRDQVLQVRTEGRESYLFVEGDERHARAGTGPAAACIPGGTDAWVNGIRCLVSLKVYQQQPSK